MYTVFGYTDMCEDFEYTTDSFCAAVKKYKSLDPWCVVFMRRGDTPCKYMHRIF